MTDTRTIRPADGRRVRWPHGPKLLAEAGETVAWTGYWERLLQAGDVVEVDPPTPGAPDSPTAKAAVSSSLSTKVN